MLIGSYDEAEESKLFDLLLYLHDMMVIDKTDSIGCSKSSTFDIKLLD